MDHTILIVDDDEQVVRMLARLVKTMGISFLYAPDAEAGLEKIRRSRVPVPLIISDQILPGLQGHEFFEQVRVISPESIRFLMTGAENTNAIINCINKGAVHYFIQKPWDNDEVMKTIRLGLDKFELKYENERLMALAKEQNSKLYSLINDLRDKVAAYQKEIHQLDQDIALTTSRLNNENAATFRFDPGLKKLLDTIRTEFDIGSENTLEAVYRETLNELFEQFEDVAVRNGFTMPDA